MNISVSEPAVLRTVHVVSVGAALPESILTNDHLSQLVDTSDEWIRPRTGMRERRILPPDQDVSDLAAAAGRQALQRAGLDPQEIDLIILATSTSSDRFGTAPQVQYALGAPQALAFDVTAACTGFIYALSTASQFLATGTYQRALVIAADVLSRTVDWTDRGTCILFGDGAGAVVLEAGLPRDNHGLMSMELRTDGSGCGLLTLSMATTAHTLLDDIEVGSYQCQPIAMNGREVFKFAVSAVPEVIEKALFKAGISATDVKGYFLHQANQRILDGIVKRLEVDETRMASVVEYYGNTSGASVPIALDHWVSRGWFEPGDVGVMAGFGAGLTWGATVFRFGRA